MPHAATTRLWENPSASANVVIPEMAIAANWLQNVKLLNTVERMPSAMEESASATMDSSAIEVIDVFPLVAVAPSTVVPMPSADGIICRIFNSVTASRVTKEMLLPAVSAFPHLATCATTAEFMPPVNPQSE